MRRSRSLRPQGRRTAWHARTLEIKDEPLLKSLLEYRLAQDRHRVVSDLDGPPANLLSSKTKEGTHLPIIDLDFDHSIEASSTGHHHHLYLNVEIPYWRWVLLMWGLYMGRVIELGYFVWSIRRGQNFVRIPGTEKQTPEEKVKPTYGWLFRKRQR